MANTDLSILLKALLDKSGINSELEQVQKIVNKYSIDIMPELKTASLRNQMKAASQDIANDFNKTFGTNITGKDVFKAYENQAKQAEKAISDAQTKRLSEQEKYYTRIINNNKEIYSLKEKKLSADKEESKELQRQIANLEKKNKRAYDSISQKDLGDKDWGQQVSASKRELENRLAIKEARLRDKANAQEQVAIERQIAEYNKQELEYQKQRKQYEAEGAKQALDEELLQQSIEYYEQEKYYQETRAKYLAEGKAQEEAYNAEIKETTEYYKQMAKEADKAYESHQRLAESNEKKVNEIQHSLDTEEYSTDIVKINNQLSKYGQLSGQIFDEARLSAESLSNTYEEMQRIFADITGKFTNADKIEIEEKYQQALLKTKNLLAQLNSDKDNEVVGASDNRRVNMIAKFNTYLAKNTAMTKESKKQIQEWIAILGSSDDMTVGSIKNINTEFNKLDATLRATGKLGLSTIDKLKQAIEKFGGWSLVTGAITSSVSQFKTALTELKEVDTYLTEISKANDSLSKAQLTEIGNNSFDVASKYGKSATDYLSGVQEASRAGYKNAESIAEISTAAQGAGDMTAELANQMIIATDKAYKLNGSATALIKVLDGINYITNHNAVNMSELSEGMTIVGSTAASFGVDINELTAALGTMTATTQQSGSEVARAFRAILLNIRQVSDEEEGINAEGLTKYEKACNALGVSLKETRNGVLQTRDAMEVLKDLSKEYNKLEENDLRRTELLNSVGGKMRATQLDALLRQWDTYEAMLQQYEDGTGSMAREAEKTANSWEGSFNRLKNTWFDTVENIANSDAIISELNGLNDILTTVNNITDKLDIVGTTGLVGGFASIGAFVKNFDWFCKKNHKTFA